jgi:hypothetical protein
MTHSFLTGLAGHDATLRYAYRRSPGETTKAAVLTVDHPMEVVERPPWLHDGPSSEMTAAMAARCASKAAQVSSSRSLSARVSEPPRVCWPGELYPHRSPAMGRTSVAAGDRHRVGRAGADRRI